MKKIFNRKGFTLIELLVSLGIIVVLLAIAIPSIIKANKTLTQKQADDYAKSIYLAIQDNLVTLRTDGTLNTVLSSSEYPSAYSDKNNGVLVDSVVSAFGDKLDALNLLCESDIKREYVYTTNSNANAFESLLPAGRIDSSILGESITVIFNNVTGDVFFVRYGELGSYCGSIVNAADSIVDDDVVKPKVRISNGQELIVKITVPVANSYSNNPQAFYDAVSLSITVSGKNNSSYVKNCALTGGELSFKPGTGEAEWVLDSLISSKSFAAQTGGQIPAGSDITVSLECDFDYTAAGGMDVEFDTSEASAIGNSLFASLDNNKIIIANGRHLSNLSKIDDSLVSAYTVSDSEVKLNNDISWGDTVAYYQKLNSKFDSNFTPLNAEKLFSSTSKIVFNGNHTDNGNKRIINLYQVGTEVGGLFKDLRVEIKDLDIVDPIINAKGNAGAFAANNYKKLTNCNLVIESASTLITAQVRSGEASLPSTTTIYGVASSGNSSVGMLCGAAYQNSVISGCSVKMGSNTIPASSINFGLAVGYFNAATIKDTIINGTVEGGKANNVGLAVGCSVSGTLNGVSVNGAVYNTSNYSASLNVGGLAGLMSSTNVTGGSVNATIDNVESSASGIIAASSTSDTVSGITATGKLSTLSGGSYGAVGVLSGGKYSNINVTTNLVSVSLSDIGGLAGRASGTITCSGTVKGNIGDGTVSGVSDSRVGGLFGYADSITLTGVVTVGYEMKNLTSCEAIGGAVGSAKNCTLNGITAKGTVASITGSSNDPVGGLIGIAEGGSCNTSSSDITASVVSDVCIGGAVGVANGGEFSLTAATAKIGDNTSNGVLGCYVGGVIAVSNNAKLVSCPSVTIAFKNFKNCHQTGGAIGYADGGTYSKITVNGSTTNIVSEFFGGVIGSAIGGTYTDITCKASLNVSYVWKLGDGSAPVPKVLGEYGSPNLTGYAGRFVGYVEKGTFTNCNALSKASGSGNGVSYVNMHFIGAVMPSSYDEMTGTSLYQSYTSLSSTVNAESNAKEETRFVAKNDSGEEIAVFVPATLYCKYENLKLNNCTYLGSDNKTTYRAEIDTDKYFYSTSNRYDGRQWSFIEVKNGINFQYEDVADAFIIADRNRKYMIGVKLGSKVSDSGSIKNYSYQYSKNSTLYYTEAENIEYRSLLNWGYFSFDAYQLCTYPLPANFSEDARIKDKDCENLNTEFLDMYTLWRCKRPWYMDNSWFNGLALQDTTIKNVSYEDSRVNDLNLCAWVTTSFEDYTLLDSPDFILGTTESIRYDQEGGYSTIYRRWSLSDVATWMVSKYGDVEIETRVAITDDGLVHSHIWGAFGDYQADKPNTQLHLYMLRNDDQVYHLMDFSPVGNKGSQKIVSREA